MSTTDAREGSARGRWVEPITLTGDTVHLRPLEPADAPALADAAADGELWTLWYTEVPDRASVQAYVERALARRSEAGELPFAVVQRSDGRVVGTTRYCNIDPEDRRLEIGYTWYAESVWRTVVNSECKYLLLSHAFEDLDAIAVEFRTHWHNHRSRRAIERLGAKQDGVLRNHRIMPDGSFRDTVVYSIIQSEWPAVSRALRHMLARP
jgi:N-acetyltransferase